DNECQESVGGAEADLNKLYDKCVKNPGHTNFIPVKEFTQQHLPEAYRNNDLFELIKTIADLTVRIGSQMVSPHRPKFWPNTKINYPFYGRGGDQSTRSGSGEMDVFRYKEGLGYDPSGSRFNAFSETQFDVENKTCPCDKCRDSDKPNSVWWVIIVNTAAHVVFDDVEAEHTSCRLFFDEPRCPTKVILEKLTVDVIDLDRDSCTLKHVTCDEALGSRLYKTATRRNDLWNKVLRKYQLRLADKLNFIVSHPHGCFKQVSIGQWVENLKVGEYEDGIEITKLTYTTSTCPGSSGAKVYCLGLAIGHVHNGVLKSGLNYSSIDLYRRF
ncbi:hypothetical protein BgiBS90_020067, partial [Biomphalaria glabrata]